MILLFSYSLIIIVNMEKGFFKVFNPETSAKRMKLPIGYTIYKKKKLPRKVSLKDRYGNMWPIRVIKNERDFYFQYGWEKFIEDNTLEYGDFLIFDYDGKETFDFKLLGINGCVKNDVGGKKKEEEMNVEHQKSAETTGKSWASDSNNSSFDDSDEDYIVEEEDTKEQVEKEEEEETHETALCSKRRYVEEEEDEKNEGEREEEIEEIGNEMAGTHKKKVRHSKDGCQNATTCNVRDFLDQYGEDIFKSGRATQPKNPYFITKINPKRRSQLYIPIDLVRDYKLEFPPNITIRDSVGREFETRVKKWADDRVWLVGGWRNLCRWNLVEKDDRCICEFVREKSSKRIHLQVQVLHEGSSSHPKNK